MNGILLLTTRKKVVIIWESGLMHFGNGWVTGLDNFEKIIIIEDFTIYYTIRVDCETRVQIPMEFIYYYVDKIKKMI